MRIDIEHLNKTKTSVQSGAVTVDSGTAITLKEIAPSHSSACLRVQLGENDLDPQILLLR
jgi:hypothetical protein